MLTVFVATFVIFALVIHGMSLGYLVKRKSIQGSCGGISSLGLEKVCDCPEPCDARKKRLAREAQRQRLAILEALGGETDDALGARGGDPEEEERLVRMKDEVMSGRIKFWLEEHDLYPDVAGGLF